MVQGELGHEQWNSIQRGRRIQEELALELHAKAGVSLHQCGIEDVKTFQRFLIGYQIHVTSREHFNGIVYRWFICMKGNLMEKSKSGHSRVTWAKSYSCIPLVTSVKTESKRFCRVFNMSGTQQLNITHVSLPKGGTGKICDYVDTERFLKDKRCIIQIQNKDDMCCARAIVTAKVKIDGHEQVQIRKQR
jgi:hypothetical protein